MNKKTKKFMKKMFLDIELALASSHNVIATDCPNTKIGKKSWRVNHKKELKKLKKAKKLIKKCVKCEVKKANKVEDSLHDRVKQLSEDISERIKQLSFTESKINQSDNNYLTDGFMGHSVEDIINSMGQDSLLSEVIIRKRKDY